MDLSPFPGTAIARVEDRNPQLLPSWKMKNKKHGAMSFLRAALFMWRRRSLRKRSKAALQMEVATASAEVLNMAVGSMRPLHSKGGESPTREAVAATALALAEPDETLFAPNMSPVRSDDRFVDVMMRPDASPYDFSSSSGKCRSRYSSALNLNEPEESEEGCDYGDNGYASGGDEMIDEKAEEFIARVYEQMRIQNYNETVRRSAWSG